MQDKNYHRCPVCKGAKKINGIGMIQKDCNRCQAVGWISDSSLSEYDGHIRNKQPVPDNIQPNIPKVTRIPSFSDHLQEESVPQKPPEVQQEAKPKRGRRPKNAII